MDGFVRVLKQYATFEGRARRAEFWWFLLACLLLSFGLVWLDHGLGLWSREVGLGLFSTLFALYTLSPTVSVAVRRLHDIGLSGWWVWINLIPMVGPLVLLAMMARKGHAGDNAYGPDPKAVGPLGDSANGS